ncbi:MAG: NAD(P)/FAD-dependent oxidoreductase [Chromatiaceae bacterium]|nr:NAD(P)/FAD-dependent oxidoreductase [Gammaproteobacteria bacterium]MCP5298134.1 NAD(P)/FAD-dependent oxidoreductase [Chromatiaceae bacterium]MCP5423326.1 NAD(P)/FAD-dependent oxidoreductase [Chromatiaceae bacterium]
MTDHDDISRRRFLQLSGATLAAAAGAPGAAAATQTKTAVGDAPPGFARLLREASLPWTSGARVVVVGGGWSGLTIAKYLKRHNPAFDVLLIDKHPSFVSFPLSNSWLADQIQLDFLSHSFFDAALNHDYHFVQATVLDVDRATRKVYTDIGFVAYDYLVLAPGIDYDYARIGVGDAEQQALLFQRYPGGFVSASELLTIKHKIRSFRGGTFLLNVPNGDYRCTAAPYERACMVAAVFKKRRVRARILLLDMNTGIKIEKNGFHRAFDELYKDYIEYLPSSEISGIDLDGKRVSTEFDEYAFDDAILYPPIRASRLIDEIGIANPQSPQKAANTDPFRYHVVGDEHVYVTGDSRGQPFSKGGHTAHSEGRYVAEVIAGHALGKDVAWRSPQTMCFSSVEIDPLQAMSIITYYKYNTQTKLFDFDRTHMIETWDVQGGQASLAWAEGMYRDLFYR